MPPRSTPSTGSFYPSNDNATYRDLLLFEERLKTNAASLQRRKSRYQLCLFQLLLFIALLFYEFLLPPQSSLLAVPYKWALRRLLPDVYPHDIDVTLHPYFASGLLFVSVTTLVLFFASGMYSEKIAYANKYVPHANRALRSFNMYLNVRKPPLRSKVYFNPASFFFPRPLEPSYDAPSSRSPSPISGDSPRTRSRSALASLPIPSIPPAANPRGELIFSSRVDKNFRESYERYRAAFERKREEKERLEGRNGWLGRVIFWKRTLIPIPSLTGSQGGAGTRTMSSSARGRSRGSRSSTPPTGGVAGGGISVRQKPIMQQGSISSPEEERSATPPHPRSRK